MPRRTTKDQARPEESSRRFGSFVMLLLIPALSLGLVHETARSQTLTCGSNLAGLGFPFEIDGDYNSDGSGLDWVRAPGDAIPSLFEGYGFPPAPLFPGPAVWVRDGNSGHGSVDPETDCFAAGRNRNTDAIGRDQEPWTYGARRLPAHADITEASVFTMVAANLDSWVMFSVATRGGGPTRVDIEYNTAGVAKVSGGGPRGHLVGLGTAGGRTPAVEHALDVVREDFILSLDLGGDGSVDRAELRIWMETSPGIGEFVLRPLSPGELMVCSNSPSTHPPDGTIPAPPWGGIGPDGRATTSLKSGQLLEVALCLRTFNVTPTSTFLIKTRLSAPFTSELGDFVIVPFANQPASPLQAQAAVVREVPEAVQTRAFPNPARSTATLEYRVPEATGTSPVHIRIFDATGRLVRTLLETTRGAGLHAERWDLTADDGRRVPTGMYFYELRTDRERVTRKVMVLQK
jgi:hypothetical protein